MPSIIIKVLRMDAVYWAPKEAAQNGRIHFETPIDIKVFWIDAMTEVVKPDGTKALAKSEVHTSISTLIGGYLALGTKADLEHPADPLQNKGAYRIIQTAEQPPIKAGKPILRRAWL
jgi:hypothetical protein